MDETVNFRARNTSVLHFWNRIVRKVDGSPLATAADVEHFARQLADFPSSAAPSSVVAKEPGVDGRTYPHVLSRKDTLCLTASKVRFCTKYFAAHPMMIKKHVLHRHAFHTFPTYCFPIVCLVHNVFLIAILPFYIYQS